MFYRSIYHTVFKSLQGPRRFIQVLLGPRQVGKTTLALQLEDQLSIPLHYVSADTATLEDLSWIYTQWEIARSHVNARQEALFIIDEIQKIPQWSSVVKKLWDEDTRKGLNLKVIILGSSPWLMQKGLSESLAGRFEIHPVTHWSYSEMQEVFGWDVDQYIYFGGYPGAAPLADQIDQTRWLNYINDSLIETTISRDILLMTQVNKPALLRRLFQLGCSYSSQILSYQKMLGQLQDAGNTTTLAHYLELLAGAGMLTGLSKYANHHVRKRSSSPKLQVFNTALMTAMSGQTFEEASHDHEHWGRLVESTIGAHLLNSIRGTQIELYYWREKSREVDFVLKKGKALIGIEVKSSSHSGPLHGMDAFAKAFKPKRQLCIGADGVPLEEFLTADLKDLF